MNERMTKRDTDGQAMMDCQKCEADWTGKHGKPMADCTALYCRNRLLDRLVEYEDTGLTPELVREVAEFAVWVHENGMDKIREWVKADKEKRLVVLPNKPSITITNADRLRKMTNQQLAKQIYDNQKELCRMVYKNLGFEDELNFSEDYSDILAWLNAQAKTGVAKVDDDNG